ncbi:phospholipase-like protein [Tanacetum coccineum]
MTDSIQLYDVKVVVRSALKLLPEIKRLLSSNPNRLNLFRRTVFGPWLDLPSHYNDNHLMHYVLQHQVHVSEITSECPPIIFRIGDHMLHFGRKEFCLLTGFRLGVVSLKHENLSCFCTRVFPDIVTEKDIRKLKSCHLLALVRDKKGWAGLHDIDAVRVCLLIVAELVFMGKEDRNCIPRHLVTLVEDLDAWNDYPWGEYMWENFYERTVTIFDEHRQHHLDEKKKNPNYNATYNLYGFSWAFKIWILETFLFVFVRYDSIIIVNLDPTPAEKIQAWFDSSIPFFNGIVDEDEKGCGDDSVLVSKDNSVDEDYNVCEDASAGLSKDEIVNDKLVDEDCNVCEDASAGLSKDNVNEKSVGINDQLLLEDGDGLFDSEAGCRNIKKDNENQSANVSIRDLYAVIKLHEERIENLEYSLTLLSPATCRWGKVCHRGTNCLTKKRVGPTSSLGIIAGDCIPDEDSPATFRWG